VRLSDPYPIAYSSLPARIDGRADFWRRWAGAAALRRRFDEALALPSSGWRRGRPRASPAGLNAAARLRHACVLVLGFEGPGDLCELEAEEAGRLCVAARAEELGPEPARQWLSRKAAEDFAGSQAWDDGTFVDTIDLAATWDRALEVHRRVREALAPLALVRARVGAAWPEGCALEFRVAASASASAREASRRRCGPIRFHQFGARSLAARAGLRARAASHHGGVGLQRLNAIAGPAGARGCGCGARALKDTFDPQGILNPGKQGAP
jgi:alkyldihydroxyacetonephosphate synthase